MLKRFFSSAHPTKGYLITTIILAFFSSYGFLKSITVVFYYLLLRPSIARKQPELLTDKLHSMDLIQSAEIRVLWVVILGSVFFWILINQIFVYTRTETLKSLNQKIYD